METPTTLTNPAQMPSREYSTLVLLVDDQAFVGEAVRRMLLREPDIAFHFCVNPAEAVSLVRRIRPTVILQDLVMPDIDGLELVRQYRSDPISQHIPILVLSTKEQPQTKSDAFAAGANDYLVKLPDRIEFLARIRYHSKACLNHIQRDEAFLALQESQRELVKSNSELLAVNRQLESALAQVKQLQGLVPICSYCKKIRDDRSYWQKLETYLSDHSEVKFTHGVCPDCMQQHFGMVSRAPIIDEQASRAQEGRTGTGAFHKP